MLHAAAPAGGVYRGQRQRIGARPLRPHEEVDLEDRSLRLLHQPGGHLHRRVRRHGALGVAQQISHRQRRGYAVRGIDFGADQDLHLRTLASGAAIRVGRDAQRQLAGRHGRQQQAHDALFGGGTGPLRGDVNPEVRPDVGAFAPHRHLNVVELPVPVRGERFHAQQVVT